MKRLAIAILLAGCGGIGNSQKLLRAAVEEQQDNLDACYAKSLKRDADAKGTMELVLHVAQSGGLVDAVSVTSSEISDPKLAKCVKAALVGVQVTPPPGADLEVAYTIEFGPES